MSGVIDGQAVNAAITNAAFIAANGPSTGIGVVSLAEAASSGPAIDNVQSTINVLIDTVGGNQYTPATSYPTVPANTITSGSTHQQALIDLANIFDNTTGHAHDGTQGGGAQVNFASLSGTQLIGYGQQGTPLTAVSGVSSDVTIELAGAQNSYNQSLEGIVTNAPYNYVHIFNSYGDSYLSASGDKVFARLTADPATAASPTAWALSYYSNISGVETPYSFAASSYVDWYYQQVFSESTRPVYSDVFVIASDQIAGTIPDAAIGIKGKSSLATSSQSVGSSNSAGTANAIVANADHAHQGVHSFAASGGSQLFGDVTLSASGAAVLNQSGQNISIYAPASGAAVNSFAASGQSALTGAVTISAGSNITLNQSGQNIEIVAAASGAAVNSLAASGFSPLTGAITIAPSGGIALNQSGQTITVYAPTGGGGVTSLAVSGNSGLTGAVTLSASGGITLTQFGQNIQVYAATGGGGPGFTAALNIMLLDTAANLWAATKTDNFNCENTVGDWAAYADAAGSAPVDMTGGSPNTTIIRTTSAINGTGSFLMTINSGASRQGEGVSCLVNVPTAYRGQTLSLVFPFNTTGTLVEDDFKIYAYDVTNSTIITPTSFSKILGANGQVSAQFPVATNTAQLRIGIHIARTSTGAATITFDDVSLSNVIVPFGLSGSNPITYTPTFTGFGTVTTQAFRYSWVGNRIIIEGSFTSGTPTATVAEISLPTNLAIDSSLGTNVPVGTYAVNIAASGQFNVLASSNGTTLKIGYSATVGAGGNTPVNGSAISSNGALITFFAVVLINNRSANLSIGESSTFSIASYLANGTRVTTTPTKLGEYRSKYKTASSQDFSAWTDTAPATAPSSANGIRIYADAYNASGTATEPNAYEIFVGKNKNISQVPVWKSANKTTSLTRGYYSTGVLAYGLKINYNQETGVLFVSAGTHNGSNTNAYVGDAIDGSDQPTDGYFDVIISENALAVSSQQPRSEIYLEGSNGHGSTNTTIRRFTSSIKNTGSAITYSDSATLGSSFTINESGVYSISYVDARDVATSYFGLSLNSSQLTTSIISITAANRLIVNRAPADAQQTVSICTVLNAGDIVRPHTDGTPTGVTLISFRITKVSS